MDSRPLLTDVRHALLRLHKTLLDWQRGLYERTHGRQSGSDLLKALFDDPQFAWLRPLSQLIVRIDEMLEDKLPLEKRDVETVIASAVMLTSPDENGDDYARRYETALQSSPDAVFAHRDLVALLPRRAREAPHPHQ
jgi:hypothetical protein